MGLAEIVGGGPGYHEIKEAGADNLYNPVRANYQIGGMYGYQQNLGDYSRGGLAVTGAPVGGYDQQQAAANMMQQTALGNGPSLARANMIAGLNNTNAAIASQAMTNMGNTGQGVTQRNLLNAQAAAANNVINQAGVASAQEQLGAQQNFAAAAQGLSNTSLAGRGQQLQAYGQAAQNANSGFQANAAQTQANMSYDQAMTNAGVNKYNNQMAAITGDASQQHAIGTFAGNVIGGVGAYLGAPAGTSAAGAGLSAAAKSDERCKREKMAATDGDLSRFMDSLEPSTFKYKDQGYSPGTHLGVMAQDVDDTPVGADMIEHSPDGMKAINVPKALGATLASLSHLNKRLDRLEGTGRNVA